MRAPWIWRQKQAQTPSTRESSMRCQPLCGASLCADGSTCGTLRPRSVGGWAAFTRRGSGDSHEARSSTGIRCMFGTSVRTYQGVIFAQTTICGVLLSFRAHADFAWCNRHAPMARHDSDNPAPAAPPRARPRGAATQPGRVTAPTEAHGEADPTGTPISLPAGRRRDTRVGSRPHTLGVTSSQFPSGSATLPDPTPV